MPPTLKSQGLVTAQGLAGSDVHLFAPGATHSLCGQSPRYEPATTSFRTHGCTVCRDHALDRGEISVREGGLAFINLRRVPPQR